MNFIRSFLKIKELDEECSICLQKICEKDVKTLRCNHKLHKKCYRNLLNSDCANKCPLCRCNFMQNVENNDNEIITNNLGNMEIIISCSICRNLLVFNEENCDVIKSNICGCFYHYECLKNRRKRGINGICGCGLKVNFEDVDMLSYLYFMNGYLKIVGNITNCKYSGCNVEGNPKRWGYCSNHHSMITTNIAFALCLQLMTRYVNEDKEERRKKIFYKILSKLNEWDVGLGVNVWRLRNRLEL